MPWAGGEVLKVAVSLAFRVFSPIKCPSSSQYYGIDLFLLELLLTRSVAARCPGFESRHFFFPLSPILMQLPPSDHRTTNPDEADFFYVPVGFGV